ncbi:MAG: DEAD/DEAH box helicase [Actinobacteria bacterium]|nr:MAG: DEAD/DEAH box helicase [Actinomycetota bacterium]
MSTQSFPDLGVSASVATSLAGRGISTPFPIQALVMSDALDGRDVLAESRTGSGKTLAFAIPIVERLAPGASDRPQALILVPTRELASQVVGEFDGIARSRKLRVAAAYGGTRIREQDKSVKRADILVATPGRLEDLADRGLVRLGAVKILVLDEADRMLDMGFEPQVAAIVRRLPVDRQTMFFSATLEGAVGHLAARYTRDPVRHLVVSPRRTVDEAEHRFIPVTEHGKADALVALLRAEPGLALVFVRTKRGADRLAAKLKERGLAVAAMHGDLSQQTRERTLARFHKGTISTLVATDVAARGLDIQGIAHVINYDPPADDNGYVHRVGRTARAGRVGRGVTLVTPDQQGDVSRIAARLHLGEDFKREGMAIAPPRVLFSSKGRRSGMRRPRRRAS